MNYEIRPFTRVVCWFSCGSTSTIAAKLAVEKYRDKVPLVVAYCDTKSEHPDNDRYLLDIQKWLEFPITILASSQYSDIWDVFDKTRYMAGIYGARCTTELKKRVRQSFEDLENDLQVFGFDKTEEDRAITFMQNNPEVNVWFPLIDEGLAKGDCLSLIASAQIRLPAMYLLGYKNNNCIGCVKGGAGYWNKIRKDFPEIFDRMSKKSRELNVRLINYRKQHIFLDELPENVGNYSAESGFECSVYCGLTKNK